jgi:hypothetical protein
MWPIARSMPAFRQGQPRTNKRKCGTQPANQSLITDVFRSRPHPCTIYRPDPQARMAVRGRSIARSALDKGHQSPMAHFGTADVAQRMSDHRTEADIVRADFPFKSGDRIFVEMWMPVSRYPLDIPRPRIFRATRFRLLERLDSAFFVLRTNRSSKPLETLRESARSFSRADRIKRAPDLTRRYKVAPQEQGCDRHFRSNRADLDCFATALE